MSRILRVDCIRTALVLLVGACGGTSKPAGSQPSWRQGLPAEAPLQQEDGQFGVAVDYYSTNFVRSDISGFKKRVGDLVADVASSQGRTVPEYDGRLASALDDLAQVVGEESHSDLVEFLMRRQGAVEPLPDLTVMWAVLSPGVEEQLRPAIGESLQRLSVNRFAVGLAKRGNESVIAVGFQVSHVDLNPVPRVLRKGGTIDIQGSVSAPFSRPHVFVTFPDGTVASQLKERVNPFRASASCGETPGKMQVEVTAEGPAGTQVLANFPVWCGVTPPNSLPATKGNVADFVEPGGAERELLRLINQDRVRFGLKPLLWHEQAANVSRSHSREMDTKNFVAHTSPTTGSAKNRVDAAGIVTPVVQENLARAYTVADIHKGLMESPGHRMNILSKDVSHVGIGLVQSTRTGNPLYVTQTFLFIPQDIDVAQGARTIANKVLAVRSGRQMAQLDVIAAQHARALAQGESPSTAGNDGQRQLGQVRQIQSAVTVVAAVSRIEDFDAKEVVKDSFQYFGVGVAQGTHPELGPKTIFTVVILAK